jgi:hypothetical protein
MAPICTRLLLCGCGAPALAFGPCVGCRRRVRLSRERFSGVREAVLIRDEYQCRGCGELVPALLLVHHVRPRARSAIWMVTLCRRCHPRVHHTKRLSFGFPPVLADLWRRLYPAQPIQLDLPLLAAGAPPAAPVIQIPLFRDRLKTA